MLSKSKEDLVDVNAGKKPGEEEAVGPKLIDKQLKKGLEKVKKWRTEAKDDYDFAMGEQWTDAEKEVLREQGRPCLTYNKIEPLIDLVSGYERENSARIRVFPEGGEDKIFSEVCDRVIKAVDKWTKLGYKLDHVFDDGITCGKGWLEMAISYDDDIIHGDLIFRQLTPYQVIPDPSGREYDQSDWNWLIKLSKYTRSKLASLYPDKAEEIATITEDTFIDTETKDMVIDNPDDDYNSTHPEDSKAGSPGVDVEDPELNLKEYWHKKKVKKFFVYNSTDSRLERFEKKDEAEARLAEIKKEYDNQFAMQIVGHTALANNNTPSVQQNPPAPPVYQPPVTRIYERFVTEMWYAACVGNTMIIEDTLSPMEPYYHGFPIFNYYAKYKPSIDKEELKVKGIVRNLKDPQRDVNKSKSQFLHILNTSANSGWIGDENALTPEGWKDLNTMGSTPGVVIRKKVGSQIDRIYPAGVPQGQMGRMEIAFQDIKEISGINSDLLAMSDKTTSGRAIALRIKQAVTILSSYFRNFKLTKEMVGTAIFAMIPAIFDVDTLKKVIGSEFMAANGVNDGTLQAVFQQIADGKYDIEISEADNSSTIRAEIFDQLLEMAGKGMPIPPDVILTFSNIPNQKEIVDKIKAYAQQQAQPASTTAGAPAPSAGPGPEGVA